MNKVAKARKAVKKFTFVKPEGGFAFSKLNNVQPFLDAIKEQKLTHSVEDVVGYFGAIGHAGGNTYQERYWLSIFVAYDRYRADWKKDKDAKRCVVSYYDPVVIDAQELKVVGLDAFEDVREARSKSINEKLSLEVLRSDTELTSAQLVRAVKSKYPTFKRVVTLDRGYWTVPMAVFKRLLSDGTEVDQRVYTPDRFDCDDFAYGLRTDIGRLGVTAVGFVHDYSSKHAYNVAVVVNDVGAFEAFLIEPQNADGAKLLPPDKIGKGNHKLESAEARF